MTSSRMAPMIAVSQVLMSKNSSTVSRLNRIWARNPPRMAPTIPMMIVTMMPPGSSPGRIALAMAPASRPRTIQPMMPMGVVPPALVDDDAHLDLAEGQLVSGEMLETISRFSDLDAGSWRGHANGDRHHQPAGRPGRAGRAGGRGAAERPRAGGPGPGQAAAAGLAPGRLPAAAGPGPGGAAGLCAAGVDRGREVVTAQRARRGAREPQRGGAADHHAAG